MWKKPTPEEASNFRWSWWDFEIVSVIYIALVLYPFLLVQRDESLFFGIWLFTAMGYLAAIPWVLHEVGLYDPPVSGTRAFWILVAGFAPWLLLWTTEGQFDDFGRRATLAAVIWLWGQFGYRLSLTTQPDRRDRTIRAYLFFSIAIALAAAGFLVRALAPGLGYFSLGPAAALAVFAVYDFATRPPPPKLNAA